MGTVDDDAAFFLRREMRGFHTHATMKHAVPGHLTQVDACPCECPNDYVYTHGRPRWEFVDWQRAHGWQLRLFRCTARRNCHSYRVIATRGDDCDEIVMYGIPTRLPNRHAPY